MLVLTRSKNQKIVVGKDVEITVVSCEDGRVKLGIDAPPHINIVRKELLEKVSASSSKELSNGKNWA